MAVTNTPAYYNMAAITAIKNFYCTGACVIKLHVGLCRLQALPAVN
jgi:hypothetical protein